MAWNKQDDLTATSIGRYSHFFDDLDGTNANRSFKFRLIVIDQEGEEITYRPDWAGIEDGHMTGGQTNSLRNFLDERRAQFPTDLSIPVVARIMHILYDDNSVLTLNYIVWEPDGTKHMGDEWPLLDVAQQNQITAFTTSQRNKAEAQIL